MKTDKTLRDLIKSQMNSEDFIPSSNFLINLNKIISNKIEMLNSVSSKVSPEVKSSKRIWLFRPQYAFSFVLVILLLITTSSYLYYKSLDVTEGGGGIIKIDNQNLTASEVLSKVNSQVLDMKDSNEIISYKISKKTYKLENGLESTPTFCQRLISYSEKLQRNYCGLDYGDNLYPIYDGNTNILSGDKIFPDPEISSKYYEKLFNFDVEKADFTEKNTNIVKIRLESNLDEAIRSSDEELSIFETQKSYDTGTTVEATKVYIDFEINTDESKIISVSISYLFSDGQTRLKSVWTFSEIKLLDIDMNLFKEITKSNVSGLELSDVSPVYDKKKKSFSLHFNAIANINYIVLKTETNGTSLVKDIQSTNQNHSIDLNIPIEDGNVIIKPYLNNDGYINYGDGVIFYYVMDLGAGYPDQLYKDTLKGDSFDGIDIPNSNQVAEIGNESTIKQSRIFSNSKLTFNIPSDWQIANIDCNESECTSITINKDLYKITIDTEAIVETEESICKSKNSIVNFSSELQRVDSFVNDQISNEYQGSCPGVTSEDPCGDHWFQSNFIVNGDNPNLGVISRGKLLGGITASSNTYIRINYAYGPIVLIDYGFLAPAKTNAEFLKTITEMDGIVRSIQFKK